MKFLKIILLSAFLIMNILNIKVDITKDQNFLSLSSDIIDGNSKIELFDVSLPDSLNDSLKKLNWMEIKKLYANESQSDIMRKFLTLRMIIMTRLINKNLDNEQYFRCSELKELNKLKGTAESFTSRCVKVRHLNNSYLEGYFKFSSGGSVSLTSDIDLSVDFILTEPNYYNSLKNVSKFISRFNKLFHEVYSTSPGSAFDLNLYSSNFANEEIIEIISNMSKNNKEYYDTFSNTNRLATLMILYNDAFKVFKDYTKTKIENKSDNILFDVYKKTFIKDSDVVEGSCGVGLVKSDANVSVFQTNGYLEKLKTNLKLNRESDDLKRLSSMEHFILDAGLTEIQVSRSIKKRNLYVLCSLITANYYAPEAYIPFSSILEMLTLQGVLEVEKLNSENQKFVLDMTDEMWLDSLFMNFAYAVEHSFHHIYQSDKFSKYVSRMFRIVNKLQESNKSVKELKSCILNSFSNSIKIDSIVKSKPEDMSCNNRDVIYMNDLLVKNEDKSNRIKCQCEMKVLRNYLTKTNESNAIKFVEDTYNCSNTFFLKSDNKKKRFNKLK